MTKEIKAGDLVYYDTKGTKKYCYVKNTEDRYVWGYWRKTKKEAKQIYEERKDVEGSNNKIFLTWMDIDEVNKVYKTLKEMVE